MRTMTRWLATAAGLVLLVCACTPQSPTPSPSPASSAPSAAGVVLSGQGAAGHAFGSPVADVEPALRSSLGNPKVTENTGCPLNPTWTRTLQWDGLAVTFEGDGAAKTSQTSLSAWQLRPDQGVPTGATLADDLPLTPTFAELTADNPGTTVTQQLGIHLVELPSGVAYLGDNNTRPDTIHGGPLQWCE